MITSQIHATVCVSWADFFSKYRDVNVNVSKFYSNAVITVIFLVLQPSRFQNTMTGSWLHASLDLLSVSCLIPLGADRTWLIDAKKKKKNRLMAPWLCTGHYTLAINIFLWIKSLLLFHLFHQWGKRVWPDGSARGRPCCSLSDLLTLSVNN